MGFATGFTGGATLTLSAAYLALLAHRRNREVQSDIVREQAMALRSLITSEPFPPPLPPRRSEVAAAQRERLVEVAKDRWNAEVVNAARWVQNTDWDEVRITAEDRIAYLWRRAFGADAAPPADEHKQHKTASRPSVARQGIDHARQAVERIEMSAENAALDARLRTKKLVQEKAAQVRDKVQAVVELAEEQLQEMTGDKKETNAAAAVEETPSPVEKALRQRFGGVGRDTRTVQQVLAERYTPMDERDNTRLRGV